MYKLYTDGSCKGNPGMFGWACVLLDENEKVLNKLSGNGGFGTNNIAELTSVIIGLKLVPIKSNVEVYSDSRYICNAFNKGWIEKWRSRNWNRRAKSELKNKQLWKELYDLTQERDVKFIWIKGHAGNKWNNLVDELAVKATDLIQL